MLAHISKTNQLPARTALTLLQSRSFSQCAVLAKDPRNTANRRLKATLKNVVEGKVEIGLDQKVGLMYGRDRKSRAQKAQTLMDFGFVLRPYMKEYFSSISNLLHNTPNFLEEKEVVGGFLGLDSLKQLSNGYTIGNIVEDHLNHKRPAYAMHLCRMARKEGTVAMNKLLFHLCKTDDFTLVFKVFNNLKKWGVPTNERTFSILTHAGVNSDSRMYKPNIKILLQIYKDAMSKTNSPLSKRIYTNSTLVSLCRFSLPRNAYHFYYEIPRHGRFSRDEVTYTTMFNLIARHKNDTDFPILKTLDATIWNEVNERVKDGDMKMTPRLVSAYCNSLSNNSNQTSYREIIDVYQTYFDFNSIPGEKQLSTKFPFTQAELDIVLRSCLHTEQYEEAINLYHNLDDMKNVKLDLSCVHGFLRNFALFENLDFKIAGNLMDRMIKLGRSKGSNVKLTSLSFRLFWRAYENSPVIDMEVVETMRKVLLPEFKIPIDDHILGGYLSLYAKAIVSSQPPTSEQALDAIKFVANNVAVISNVQKSQPNPLRIDKALNNAIVLSRYVLDDAANFEALRAGELKWLLDLRESCKALQKTLEKTFRNDPVYSTKYDHYKAEERIFHENQKEILRRFRKVIPYHEIHIAKPTMKNIKTALKQHSGRTIVEPPAPLKPHEELKVA